MINILPEGVVVLIIVASLVSVGIGRPTGATPSPFFASMLRNDLKRIVANLSLSWPPFVFMLENM